MLPLALLLLSSASASSFYEQPFPDTVKNAPTIVRGKVGKSEVQWTTLSDGSKHLFTYTEVMVSEGLKGNARSGLEPIRIRELGGTKDGVSLNVSGTAGFDAGEDVVVMLGNANASGDGAYPVVGMMMGKYVLEKGADGNEYLRGPGLGSALRPELRNEHSEGKTIQVSLQGLRDIIRTQASEVQVSPRPDPAVVKASPSLGEKTPNPSNDKTPITDGNLAPPEAPKSLISVKPLVLGVGILFGVAWFLKSRRKRR